MTEPRSRVRALARAMDPVGTVARAAGDAAVRGLGATWRFVAARPVEASATATLVGTVAVGAWRGRRRGRAVDPAPGEVLVDLPGWRRGPVLPAPGPRDLAAWSGLEDALDLDDATLRRRRYQRGDGVVVDLDAALARTVPDAPTGVAIDLRPGATSRLRLVRPAGSRWNTEPRAAAATDVPGAGDLHDEAASSEVLGLRAVGPAARRRPAGSRWNRVPGGSRWNSVPGKDGSRWNAVPGRAATTGDAGTTAQGLLGLSPGGQRSSEDLAHPTARGANEATSGSGVHPSTVGGRAWHDGVVGLVARLGEPDPDPSADDRAAPAGDGADGQAAGAAARDESSPEQAARDERRRDEGTRGATSREQRGRDGDAGARGAHSDDARVDVSPDETVGDDGPRDGGAGADPAAELVERIARLREARSEPAPHAHPVLGGVLWVLGTGGILTAAVVRDRRLAWAGAAAGGAVAGLGAWEAGSVVVHLGTRGRMVVSPSPRRAVAAVGAGAATAATTTTIARLARRWQRHRQRTRP